MPKHYTVLTDHLEGTADNLAELAEVSSEISDDTEEPDDYPIFFGRKRWGTLTVKSPGSWLIQSLDKTTQIEQRS